VNLLGAPGQWWGSELPSRGPLGSPVRPVRRPCEGRRRRLKPWRSAAAARRPHFGGGGGGVGISTGGRGVRRRRPAKGTIFAHEIVPCHQTNLQASTDFDYLAGKPLIGMLKLILCICTSSGWVIFNSHRPHLTLT